MGSSDRLTSPNATCVGWWARGWSGVGRVKEGGQGAHNLRSTAPQRKTHRHAPPITHLRVVRKRLRDGVPRGRLLPSSASALGSDPADEECATGVNLALDVVLKHALRALGDDVEMAVRVDRPKDGAKHGQSRGHGGNRQLGSGEPSYLKLPLIRSSSILFWSSFRFERQRWPAICDSKSSDAASGPRSKAPWT